MLTRGGTSPDGDRSKDGPGSFQRAASMKVGIFAAFKGAGKDIDLPRLEVGGTCSLDKAGVLPMKNGSGTGSSRLR